MESFPSQARDVPLRRRAQTSWDSTAAGAAPAIVSPEQTRRRRETKSSSSTKHASACNGDDDDCHLSSCSSSSLGGGSSVSGSSDFHRGALTGGHYYSRHRQPQAQQLQHPQLHRRHTYAGGPVVAAAAAATGPPPQRHSVAIEIPAAMKEVVIRHSRSKLLAEADAEASDGNDNDNDDDSDASSTLSSLEVDLGHGRSPVAEQDDPRRQYWADRRRGASHHDASGVYSSTSALCGGDDVGAGGIGIGGTGTGNEDDTDQHGDDDDPSYMSYSLSTGSPCKSARVDRCSSHRAAARNHHRKSPGHFKSQSRDSSLLGGLGLLEITSAAASGGSAAVAVYGADGKRSASPLSFHQSDSLDLRPCRAAPQAQQLDEDTTAETTKGIPHQHHPKRSLSHRRHFSESILLNTSIGTDTTAESESSISNCLSPPPHQFGGSSFAAGPPPSSLLQLLASLGTVVGQEQR